MGAVSDAPIILGQAGTEPLAVDLDALIGSHLGIVANAGGGKSGLVRKLLEVTHGHVQHIVLDSEDEFYTLRERFDYVIAGGDGGDTPATVANAAQLAIAALTHGFSLIVQLNDLHREDQNEFIDRFLAAMIGAPKDLWHPCLVVVDEAQRFDADVLRQLTEAGRKRGFTAVLATQRLPKLDPNIRGDLNNWIMGRVGQTLDRRIMADQLGLPKAGERDLARIEPRHFYAFGPALSRDPALFRVDEVETTIVRPGQAKVHTPPPPEALREILSALAPAKSDSQIPTDAATDDNGRTDISAEIGNMRRRLADLETERDEWTIERCVGQQQLGALVDENRALRAIVEAAWADVQRIRPALSEVEAVGSEVEDKPSPHSRSKGSLRPASREAGPPATLQSDSTARPGPTRGAPTASTTGIPASQQRVLDAIAWWEAVGITPVERNRASVIAGLSPKASTFGVYVSKLAQVGLVETSTGAVALTDAGRAAANSPGCVDRREVVNQARSMLKPAAAGVFDKILGHWPEWVRRDALADECSLSRTASTLGVYISDSSKLGFVETKPGMVRIAPWMMP